MLLVFWGLFLPPTVCSQLLSVTPPEYSVAERKFLLYDVNFGEGFNLRRDVFMRVANAVRILRENGHNYVLVLPPWGGLQHWTKYDTKLPWSLFFDVGAINEFVPVIEFHEFLKATNNDAIDAVVYLQAYAEGWTSGNYEVKFDKRDCIDGDKYYRFVDGSWRGWFFSYKDVRAANFLCVSIQGDSKTLVKLIERDYLNLTSVFVDRAETVLHDRFGDKHYWEVRRSMRYAHNLRKIADNFRLERLGSEDSKDRTEMVEPWTDLQKKHGDARGGDFVCAHWRRRDFVRSHSKNIPSIEGAAQQISKILAAQNLSKVFLSTDAVPEEISALRRSLPSNISLELFVPDDRLSDGEVSIIDQWICAHARYFIGTHYSTFSFRIQEDREILGFLPEATFNCLCPDDDENCEQPSKWKIVYEDNEEFY